METQDLYNAPVATKPAMIEPESQRAIAEVQGQILLAKKFPRNIKEAFDKIMVACQRPGLAEAAVYTYAKGGTEITGPSIRLAEVIAQNWGNISFGIRELDQRNGESTMEAFAWDMESNVRQTKVFQVRHIRHTRKGSYALEDPREIYEMTANQGARRLRSCILGIIPGDITEEAVMESERTMKAKADTGPDGIKKLVSAFEVLGVSRDQIEKRIQRRLDSITAAQMVSMRKIYNSLKDNMSTIADWFEVAEKTEAPEEKKTGVEAAKEALRQVGKQKLATNPPEKEKSPQNGTQEAKDTRPDLTRIPCPDGDETDLGYCRRDCVKKIDCQAWR
jgi:hypothetical protein